MKYSIVGLGKLGASMAAAIGSRGHQVIGVDVSRHAVDAVNSGRAPVHETGLAEMIAANRERITATTSHRDAVLGSDLTFVIVPTPSDDQGAFSLQYAAWAFGEIGDALADKRGYHTVVLTSTVLPGATRYGLLPILEQRSGKTCGKDFGLCYSPEFIALGSVIRDFLNPDFTLVGEFDERSGGTLEDSYAAIMLNNPPCRRMSLENAELTKISVNTFVTTKIAFANMIADLCERIPGGDADVVCNALGSDARIGRKYLTGALGYGGPCFPRDNVALSYIARALGSSADLAETTDRMNRRVAATVLQRLHLEVKRGATVAILGLSYKPHSHVIEESQGIALARALADAGARVVGHDPLAGPYAAQELGDHAVILDSVADCLAPADVVVIANADPAYRDLGPNDFQNGRPSITVVDCWRLLAGTLQNTPHLRYVAVGRGVDEQASGDRLRALWTLPAEPARETAR
jgi:UDPglucose 6-dehydrogenase